MSIKNPFYKASTAEENKENGRAREEESKESEISMDYRSGFLEVSADLMRM